MSRESQRTLREARDAYFGANGLPPGGGYDERWVWIRVGPLSFAFPNSAGRRRAVPFHDLHHVLTGYSTDLAGEAEIAAWEIASGCRQLPAALYLDLLVMGFVLPRRPGELFRAFVRGRNSRNLYATRYGDELLGRSVGEVRGDLCLDRERPQPRIPDAIAFTLWAALAVAIVWGPALLLAPLAWMLLR